MIELTTGNLLEADTEALVNTVNCVGHMGKGIALQFKQAFPDNYEAYQKACKTEEVRPGKIFVHQVSNLLDKRYILNFPTKRHWSGKSRIEDIESGLQALVAEVRRLGVRSIAVPPLGCGLGGLPWHRVRPLIERAFEEIPDVKVLLFEPHGAPAAEARPIKTEKPKLTPARALFIKLIEQYLGLAYRLTLLEIQKLAYFLQHAGQPLRLNYIKGLYGPYADNLNKVLELLEGHYTRGYVGERKPDEEIELLPGAIREADKFLAERDKERERLGRVADLIAGFETPYGMELVSSVHWVATEQEKPVETVEQAIEHVHAWNERKRKMLKPEHIRVAWEHLRGSGWL